MQSRKRVQKPIKTRYPEGQSKEHYLRFLISKYKKLYPDISEEQIKVPINKVVGWIALAIESKETLEAKMEEVSFLKRFVQEEHFRPEQNAFNAHAYYVSLYYFKEGMKNAPWIALNLSNVPFPEEYEKEYLCFTKEMSCEAISGITQATEDFIKVITNKENSVPGNGINNALSSKKVSFFFGEAPKEKKENSSDASSALAVTSKPPGSLINSHSAGEND